MPTTAKGWERAIKRADLLRRLRLAADEIKTNRVTRRFHKRVADWQAAYDNATHPTQRIKAWLKLTKAGGQLSDNRLVELERAVFFRGRGDSIPNEVINMRMMG